MDAFVFQIITSVDKVPVALWVMAVAHAPVAVEAKSRALLPCAITWPIVASPAAVPDVIPESCSVQVVDAVVQFRRCAVVGTTVGPATVFEVVAPLAQIV